MVLHGLVPDILTEFLEVATHNIIHARKIYPDSIFTRSHKYGVVIYKSIHPQVNEYITECIKAVHHLAKINELAKVVICFMQPNSSIEEKVVFDILNLKEIYDKDPFLLNIENYFRTFCLRLYSSCGYLQPLSGDYLFAIQIYTTESAAVAYMDNPETQEFPWLNITSSNANLEDGSIIPIETFETDFLKIQIYFEKKRELL